MRIKKQDNLFYLGSKDVSLIIEERDGYLFLKHYGRKINDYHFSNAIHEIDHSFSPNPTLKDRTFQIDTQRNIIGQFGRGDFREPSLRIQFDNNETTDFRYFDYEVVEGLKELDGLPSPYSKINKAKTLILKLKDEVAKLQLHLYYSVYEDSNTITMHQELINTSTEDIVIHKLHSAMLDVPSRDYDVISFQGGYAREKKVNRYNVKQGLFEVSSRRGASSHSQSPALILLDQDATEYYGEAFSLQLMYSGNFQAYVQQNQLNEVRVGIGINEENFKWLLKPEESFQTPVAVLSYSYEGLNSLTQESHHFIVKHVIPEQFANQERPILVNNWEATYFDFDYNKLMKIAHEAKNLGVELFVLDDGWYGNRNDDMSSLGDWFVNETKLKEPLSKLIKNVHHLGMKFGLWVEPETISVDSELYRKHPEWAIQLKNREHTFSRSELVLDFSNPEVVEYIKEIFDNILTKYDIDYIKWDFNRNITDIGNGKTYLDTMKQSHQYMLGLYDLVEFLTTKHNSVLFESCSGGGGRNDLGMLRYFPQVWASDNTDAIERLKIQYGSSYLMPNIAMGAHVSEVPNHQMNRITPLETRGNVAMMGNLGYELDLTKLSNNEKMIVKEQIEKYKLIRPIIQFGTQYRLINPEDFSNETSVQFNYKGETVVFYVRVLSKIEEIETTIKLKNLDEGSLYKIEGTETIYSGAELMYAGLTMDIESGDYLSKMIHLQQVN